MGFSNERLLGEVENASPAEANAYLLGAVHDATLNRCHGTTRFTQNDRGWLEAVAALLLKLDARSWMYREGRDRSVWALETSWRGCVLDLVTREEEAAYARGYFDAEGGVPRDLAARFYVQFVQKDKNDLEHVKSLLTSSEIECGRLHNPSHRVDPDYWRFYVRARSHSTFIERIGSWHPRKRQRMAWEMKRDS